MQSLSRHFLTEITVQVTREPPAGELAASEIFREELFDTEELRTRAVRNDGQSPEEGIAAECLRGDYNLVILAPAGRRGFIRLFYGSMVAQVVREVSSSVMIVRAGVVPPRRILTCVSGSRHSLTNVRAAAQIAVAFGATVTIKTVMSQLPRELHPGETAARVEAFRRSDHPLAVHLRSAEDLLHNLGAKGGVRVCEGFVVEEILEEMETFDHDLLILGTHRAEGHDSTHEDLTSELVQRAGRTTLVVGLRADLL